MVKSRNLSSTLSIYLLGSEMLLTVILIIVGYWFAKNLIVESLFHKLQYHTEEAISPIQNSMKETEWLIANFVSEFDSSDHNSTPEKYVPYIFKVKPSVVAFRFVIFNPLDTNRIKRDIFFFRNGDSLKTNKDQFYRNFPFSANWMNNPSHRINSEWSSPFYSTNLNSGYKQILFYSQPAVFNINQQKYKGIITCAISLDKELKNLSELSSFKNDFPILISGSGNIVYPNYSNNPAVKDANLKQFLDNLDIHQITQENIEGSKIIHPLSLNKKKSIAFYWAVSKINWVMVMILPESEILSALNRLLILSVLIIVFFGGISTAITIYLSRRLVSPITTLAHASRKIIEEEGEKSPMADSEIEILSQSIDLMKRKLRNYEKDRLKTEMDNEEMDKELNLAKEIEMGIVPTKFPLFPGRTDFDCYGKLLPAKIVGGDLFDFFLLDEDHLFLSICDTLGKGIPAAMFAVATRTLIRSIANPITRIGKMMELLNDELSLGHDSDMYVTVMMGRLDLTSGEFAYCNAGHPRPFIVRSNSHLEEFEITHGFPIGVRKKQKYFETTVKLNPGDTIVAYTDGITEEMDKMGTFFGKERLYSIVQSQNTATPEKLIKEVLKSLEKFRGKKEIYDDTTMLAVKFLGKEKVQEVKTVNKEMKI